MKPKRDTFLLAVALAVATLAYVPSLRGEFQFDDRTSIQTNWAIRDPARLLDASWLDILGPTRPITDASFALTYAVAGLDPLPYHLVNLALHLVAAFLAFVFVRSALRRIGHTRAGPIAVLTAAAFALHPLQTESVSYIVQRAEVLSSALFLGTLLLLGRAYDARRRRAALGWASAATVTTALALGAKAIAVTIPVVFLVWALAFGRREDNAASPVRRAVRALTLGAGGWALAISSVILNLTRLGPAETAGLHAGDLGPWRYLLTELRVHWWYARLLVWPAGQSVDPAFSPSPSPPDVETWAAGAVTIVLLGAAAWLLWRSERDAGSRLSASRRTVAFGIIWWYLVLAPTSSVVPIADVAAEHRVYLAVLGAILAIAATVDALATIPRAPRGTLGVAAAIGMAACVALGITLASRASVWATELSLWQDAAEKNPGKHRPVANHAYALAAVGRREEAIREFARAQALARTPRETANVARNLAALHLIAGRPGEALGAAEAGLAAVAHDWELRVCRADALRQLMRLDEAYEEAMRAVTLSPREPQAQDMLGLVLLQRGEPERALAQFDIARAIDPSKRVFAEHAFLALAQLGRRDEACVTWAIVAARGGSANPLARSEAVRFRCAASR